ncbi:MAG: hypothetical protein ACT4QF_13920 [Sporichthyaceae bacterium]
MRRSRRTVATGVAATLLAASGAVLGNGSAQAVAQPYDPGLDPGIAVEFAPTTEFALSPELAAAFGRPTLTADAARALLATPAAAAAGTTPAVGTVRRWPAIDETSRTGLPIVGIYLKEYELLAAGERMEVWVASGSDEVSTGTAFPAGDCRSARKDPTVVTQAQAERLVEEFTTTMLPAETKAFSTAPDADGALSAGQLAPLGVDFRGNGKATVLLVDNVRDGNFYDFENNRTYIAGFFAPIFNTLTNRNVMTLDAFDWEHRTGENPPNEPNRDLCLSRPGRALMYEATLAHEYQHLLHSYTDRAETTWLNEGLSDMAEFLVGYAETTVPVSRRGAESHLYCFQGHGLTKGPSNPNPIPCGGPQNSLTLWEDEGGNSDVLADYGNAWSFLLYLHDRFGPQIISDLHRDGARQGLASVQAALDVRAPGTKVMDVVSDFQLMNLLDNLASAKGAKVSGIEREKVVSANLAAAVDTRAKSAYALPGAAPNGADYVELRANGKYLAGRSLRSLEFLGARTVPLTQEPGNPFADLGAVLGDPEVESWNVRLVGIDRAGKRALVKSFRAQSAFTLGAAELAAFASYPTVVAVVAHEDSRELIESYARYRLTVNGRVQLGGAPVAE